MTYTTPPRCTHCGPGRSAYTRGYEHGRAMVRKDPVGHYDDDRDAYEDGYMAGLNAR